MQLSVNYITYLIIVTIVETTITDLKSYFCQYQI